MIPAPFLKAVCLQAAFFSMGTSAPNEPEYAEFMPKSLIFSHTEVRRYGFGLCGGAPLSLFTKDADIKQHKAYTAAKAGDIAAAMQLISDLALSFIFDHRHQFSKNHIFVAPHAREASGDNAIPQVLAEVCALVAGAKADTDIVQTTKVFHTGADPMERMGLRAQFEGNVVPLGQYVLVDDVCSLGGTLAELANYIQLKGGQIAQIFVLVNAGRTSKFKPEAKIIRLLEKRYGHEITEIFGIEPAALTANEASYLVGFRTADEIRNRLAKARQETHLRLRSKGIGATDQGKTGS